MCNLRQSRRTVVTSHRQSSQPVLTQKLGGPLQHCHIPRQPHSPPQTDGHVSVGSAQHCDAQAQSAGVKREFELGKLGENSRSSAAGCVKHISHASHSQMPQL